LITYFNYLVRRKNMAETAPSKRSRFDIDNIQESPLRVAISWIMNAVLYIFLAILTAQSFETFNPIAAMLSFAGGPMLAALLVSACTSGATNPLKIAIIFLQISITISVVSIFLVIIILLRHGDFNSPFLGFLAIFMFVFYLIATYNIMHGFSTKRRLLAVAAIFSSMIAGPVLSQLDESFYRLAWAINPPQRPANNGYDNWTPVYQESLWQAQPKLIENQLAHISKQSSGTSRIFTMAIGAQGSQSLFSREAKIASAKLSTRFATSGNTLLINGRDELSTIPVATPRNFRALANGLGNIIDPSQDTVILYLTSHGGRRAWLATDLPDFTDLPSITAYSVKAALDEAKIKRRVIIVSACYAGSWIPILANPDTIILTAASADTTSFGCDDRRQLTYFGEAFLESLSPRNASLSEVFSTAKAKIARREKAENIQQSLPQYFVGANMKEFWLATTQARVTTN
jgi:Peptidase C13 family